MDFILKVKAIALLFNYNDSKLAEDRNTYKRISSLFSKPNYFTYSTSYKGPTEKGVGRELPCVERTIYT
jgi:hypothetical protein